MFSFVYGGIDFAHKLDAASSPTESYYKHVHTHNEIVYFVDGDATYTVELETRRLKPGDVVLIPSGKYHFATVNPNVPYERYVLKFPESMLPKFLASRFSSIGPFVRAPSDERMRRFDDYYGYGGFNADELHAMFWTETVQLLVTLSKSHPELPDRIDPMISMIVKYIDEHIKEPISLDSLSEAFLLSKSHLCNIFKQQMKIPLMQYVRKKKIIAAYQLVLAGERKVRVAEMLGFESYSTFYRQYVRLLKEDGLPVPKEDTEES